MKARDRSRVSYPQSMRDRAKAEGKGLVTVHIVEPDGRVTRIQKVAECIELSAAYELFNELWAGRDSDG